MLSPITDILLLTSVVVSGELVLLFTGLFIRFDFGGRVLKSERRGDEDRGNQTTTEAT